MIHRAFYTLPEPKGAGLKWREFEKAREKVQRIDKRLQETGRERARLEQEIKDLDAAAVRELAEAVLAGTDDPAADHGEHAKLVQRLQTLRREEQAIQQALPRAEEELRLTVFEHQHRWKDEADAALEKSLAEERQAYEKAEALVSEPRARRLYLEALAGWVRSPSPTFGVNVDTATAVAMQNLASGVYAAEQRLEERRYNEQVMAAQQQGVA